MSHNVGREPQDSSQSWDLLLHSHSHILVEGTGGRRSERSLSCLSMARVTIVRGPAINLQAFRVFV